MRFDKARLSTGLRIHYAESGDARGTPVVFVHGWPDSWFSFSRVLPLLPATLRLIALDQRGFGESDHPDSGYTIPGFAADLVSLLDALDIVCRLSRNAETIAGDGIQPGRYQLVPRHRHY